MIANSELSKGLVHGFLDRTETALESYKPRLIINDPERGEKVLTSIIQELSHCDAFYFSVAFITESGVTVLLNTLKELEEKGIQGKIIASQYQNFSSPKALKKLLELKNVELRIVTQEVAKMHTKAYIFRKGEEYSIIVGSSNMTQSALCENKEWNLKVSSSKEGAIVSNTIEEFNSMFAHATIVDINWIDAYSKIYELQRNINSTAEKTIEDHLSGKLLYLNAIKPNKMQVNALQELEATRNRQHEKTLIISATGTGKTYLSAFDVKKFNPKRFLFVVHREQIAKEALKSFRKVIGFEKTMSILSGNHKDFQADYIFTTIQTLSKEHIYRQFSPDDFEYIVIDEVHRAGAKSYKTIIDYFQPKFLLGMSATPERTDGFDIFELFDHNIAYEIRLNDAMKEDLICPFHYFGITELMVEGKIIDDQTQFNHLVSDARVQYIKEKVEFYGYSGSRVKGLVFCSRNEEAQNLSQKFNDIGYRTVALSGASSQEERAEAVQRLGQDENEGALDYIFTVDIFNEGVDIPEINQVVMLRPTKSAIIFVQQLGRGLRKVFGKEYVVVLDFIGNYDNNYLIPIALSGDQSYNKDNIRRYVAESNRIIYGCSTINFDKITRERIYKSIDHADFNDLKIIKESYQDLKNRLGRIPLLTEFIKYNVIDIERIFARTGSYHNFLRKYEKDYQIALTSEEEKFIEFISLKYANGKRPHELEFIKLLLNEESAVLDKLDELLFEKYRIEVNENTRINLINQMTQNFATGSSKNTFAKAIFIEKEGQGYKRSSPFLRCLQNPVFQQMVTELLNIGLRKYEERYSNHYRETNFVLNEKYTYEDVCRLLDWSKNEVPLNIGGYKFDKETKTFPVFINYHKDDDISETIQYHDEFFSPSEFLAFSKSGRTIQSDDVQTIYSSKDLGVDILLFVRKDKTDKTSKEFYFLGKIDAVGSPVQAKMPGTNVNVVKIRYKLDVPVRDDLYDYITQEKIAD